MTLSTPIKLAALAGVALLLGAAGLFTLLSAQHGAAATAAPPAVNVIAVQPAHTTTRATPPKPKLQLQLSSNLPTPVRVGLERSREVVAVVYSPTSAVDRGLVAEVRAGARAAHVGFVALNVQNEPTAAAVYGWAASAADPAVLVVRRPGKILFTLHGPTDRDAVAQAAVSAK